MATSKARAKGKIKKSIGRLAKMKLGNKEAREADTSDLSQLRKPIDISPSSLRQVAQLFEKGSDEVRDILTYECDVVYECRICRSLFRSLANLISHKRIYCPEKYSVNSQRPDNVHMMKNVHYKNNNSEQSTLVDFDYKENYSNDRILRSQATRKEPKKDLTSVVDMLVKKQQNSDFHCNNVDGSNSLRISNDNEQVLLEMIDSNKAAYQTIVVPSISPSSNGDLMKSQTEELRNMSERTTAVLGPDGHFDFNINAPNATLGKDLTCTACNTKFATKKTLTFHVKCKHTSHRVVGFPCPCCLSTFTNRWSVYRHLFKVHRKSNEQVRKLRSQIQARAFRRDPSRLEKIFKSSESADQEMTEEASARHLREAQEGMGNLELDAELQRCGACGKRFDRKAALTSHSQICKERGNSASISNGLAVRRHKRASKKPPQRVVETLDSSDSSILDCETSTKAPASNDATTTATTTTSFKPLDSDSRCPSKETPEIAIRVEDVSSLSKDVWDMIGNDDATDSSKTVPTTDQLIPPAIIPSEESQEVKTSLENVVGVSTDVPEVIYTSIDNSRPVTLSVLNTEKKLGIQYRGIRLPTVTLEKININRIDSASRQPAISLDVPSAADSKDKTFSSLVNFRKLQCLPCNRKFVSLLTLRRHIAVHRRRSRYSCKLCDFQAFLKCDFIAHCNKKHDARNNRKTLSELIIEMPVNNDCSPPSSNLEDVKLPNDFEVIDVTRGTNGSPSEIELRENQASEANTSEPSAVDTVPIEKPRRGRPPKAKGKKQKKQQQQQQQKKMMMIKRNARRARHVSPPALNDELFEDSTEMSNINDTTELREKRGPSNKPKRTSRLRAPSRMDCDPELRKMVMEVIFGPAEKPDHQSTTANGSNEITMDDVTIEKLEADYLLSDSHDKLDSRISSTEQVERIEQSKASRISEIQAVNREQDAGNDHRLIVQDYDRMMMKQRANNNLQRDKNKPFVVFSDDISIVEESLRDKPVTLRRRISTNGRLVKLQSRDRGVVPPPPPPPPPHETVRLIVFEHDKVSDAASVSTVGVRQANILVPAER